jgi:hypothetical protein
MGRRGFVLTLDAAIAMFVVLSVLAYSDALLNDSRVGQWSEYRLLVAGQDIAAALYSRGMLQSADQAALETAVNESLPPNYGMKLEVRSYRLIAGQFVNTKTVNVGPPVPDSAVQAGGRRTFITFSGGGVDSYGVAEYWVWLR